MTFGSLFAGIGGMDLGLERAGMTCRWQVEIAEFPRRILAKHWPNIPRYGDIREVKGADLEPVDLICGGFPCEDISLASATSVGIVGARSGLWTEYRRILAEVRPRFALIENVPALRNRGLALVLQDLAALGFDAEWHCIPASAFGAYHERDRIFIIAYPAGMFREAIIRRESDGDVSSLLAEPDAYLDGFGCDGRAWQSGPDGGGKPQNRDCELSRHGTQKWGGRPIRSGDGDRATQSGCTISSTTKRSGTCRPCGQQTPTGGGEEI